MLQIGETLVSLDVIEKNFVCNLAQCKGECCIDGDAGAPLTKNEITEIEKNYTKIKKHLSEEGKEIIAKQGISYIDEDGEPVTSLINGNECAFVTMENGTAKCAIEKSYLLGEINFIKPVSCHLYPIRIKKYNDFDAINYDIWEICNDAISNGNKLGVPIYKFLKEPLIRKYGTDWYNELEFAAKEYLAQK